MCIRMNVRHCEWYLYSLSVYTNMGMLLSPDVEMLVACIHVSIVARIRRQLRLLTDYRKLPYLITLTCRGFAFLAILTYMNTSYNFTLQVKARSNLKLEKAFSIIVHIGCNALPDAQRLAAHAESMGVDGIAIMAPSFFIPTSASALVRTVMYTYHTHRFCCALFLCVVRKLCIC